MNVKLSAVKAWIGRQWDRLMVERYEPAPAVASVPDVPPVEPATVAPEPLTLAVYIGAHRLPTAEYETVKLPAREPVEVSS